MSPRPRKASDEAVFLATTRVMLRSGPSQITLAEIAAEAGPTAGALVQRFGSKRGLLLTLAERFANSTAEMFDRLRAADPSALATLYAYADCMAGMADSPDALAHHLAWLQQDLTDPDFRRYTLIHARASRRELLRLVQQGIDEGTLKKDVEPAALARAIEVTVSGSLMSWAIHQEGKATTWMRHDLEALLERYLTTAATRDRRKTSLLPGKRVSSASSRRVRLRHR
jgi:AcrR family transcriptional regulator